MTEVGDHAGRRHSWPQTVGFGAGVVFTHLCFSTPVLSTWHMVGAPYEVEPNFVK